MNLIDVIKSIPKGTFNYSRYKKEYRCKFNREIDIMMEYAAQLPYFKIITFPIAAALMLLELLPIILVILFEHFVDKLKSILK